MRSLWLILLFSLLWSVSLFAEAITHYEVDLAVEQSGELQVVERIEYDFQGAIKHGIFRDIPSSVKIDGVVRKIGLCDFTLKMDSTAVEFQQSAIRSSDAGELIRLKIGSPSTQITGKHIYTIGYRVQKGVLPSSVSAAQDAIRWNLIGTGWEVPILRSTANISLPKSLEQSNVSVKTFMGSYGSTQSGGAIEWRDAHSFSTQQNSLQPHEGVTVEISFPTGLLDQTGANISTVSFAERIFNNWFWLALIGYILYLVHFLSENRGFVDERSIAPRYNPPKEISILQSALIYDKFANNEDYSAAILELAQQGHLEIFQEQEKDDPFLKKTDKSPEGLTPDMLYLLNSVLFKGRSSRLLKKNDTTNAADFKRGFESINSLLYQWSESSGHMQQNPLHIRKNFLIRSAIFMVPFVALTLYTLGKTGGMELLFATIHSSIFIGVGIGIFFSSKQILQKFMGLIFALAGSFSYIAFGQNGFSLESILFSPLTAIVSALIALYIVYKKLGAYTHKGAITQKHLLGLKEFMSRVKADEIKRRLAEDPLYLEKGLPYAVLFGITKHWLKLYEEVDVSSPLWYHGHYSNLGSFASQVHSSMTPPPSSSGGFSGGGGSSGGGGGGGGGGSW